MTTPPGSSMEVLLRIMAMLRDEQHGCPWDRQQTFRTIAPHTLEEVYEVVDAIEREDYGHLVNELGDLLFQVVFYAQLGREAGHFDFADIVTEISDKLLKRHPHVFPEGTMESFGSDPQLTPAQVEGSWERIKRAEREDKSDSSSILDDIPGSFPALLRARKLQKRAATTGFDWPDSAGVRAKLDEELAELDAALASRDQGQVEDELGDMFFTLVNLARHLRCDPETCLRQANIKFEQRFRLMEKAVIADGKSLDAMKPEELEHYWQLAKQQS